MKMSQRIQRGVGMGTEVQLTEVQRIEQERIDFEHRAHKVRDNLYGHAQGDVPRGWVDKKSW
jgi:hypothetical protein